MQHMVLQSPDNLFSSLVSEFAIAARRPVVVKNMQCWIILKFCTSELKVLRPSPGMILYAAADTLIKSQKESTRVQEEYVVAIGSACPRRPCSTAVEFCHNMLHNDLSSVIHIVIQIENLVDADCINTIVMNDTTDLCGQILLAVPWFLRSFDPGNVVKC